MPVIKDQQNIDEIRKRLYDRNAEGIKSTRHTLTKVTTDVSRGWGDVRKIVTTPAPSPEFKNPDEVDIQPLEITPVQKKRPYRKYILLASVGFFTLVAILSSVYLFFGVNQISAKNISLTISAPFGIAAGDSLPLQISVSNQNSVQVESATLIINYPSGTKTANEEARDIYEERIPIEVIAAGEALNIPTSILLFGEENEDKEIKASIEYRVSGSNGTFFKEAEPIKVKISSSPLVVKVESVEKVSSGQEIEIKIILQSNAAAVQRNLLVSASYPNSFIYSESDPKPVYGENEWLIDEIQPRSTKTIILRGRINGLAGEEAEIKFSVGTPRSDNQFIMGSTLSKTQTSYTIERAFIEVGVEINQDKDGTAVIDKGQDARVKINVKNTLDESIYDMRVEVTPKGNLVRDNQLVIDGGFYDSGSKVISYEVSGTPSLAEVRPGETKTFEFIVKADPNQTTGSFDVSTSVFAKRVGESRVSEQVVGTAIAQAKYSSEIDVSAQVGRNDGNFADVGPIPPQAQKETTYTITLVAEAGINDTSNMTLTTTLPQYVTWLDKYEGEGSVVFNTVNKQLLWSIGNLSAKTQKQLKIQVSLLPSVTQVGKTPIVMGVQELKATDRFTEVNLRAQNIALDTKLSTEAGFNNDDGKVVSGSTN